MKLSTFGMWEKNRLELVNDLFNDLKPGCELEQINKALLEPVITTIINTAFNVHQKFQQENSPLSLKERTLAAYEIAFSTMLPTLAESLNKPKDLLSPHVEKFVFQSLSLSKQNIDYLMQLGAISIKIKTEEIAKLYGKNFSQIFPKLVHGLFLNDLQLMEKAAKAVSSAIEQGCPTEIFPMMAEHIKYMNEISVQKTVTPQFAEHFKNETGMTMDEYKAQTRLSTYTSLPSLSLVGHFKMRVQLKETVQEAPAINLP